MDAFERELLTPDPPKPTPIPWRCKRGWHKWGKWSKGKRITYTEDQGTYGYKWIDVVYIVQESNCIDCNLIREQKTKAI
jgi:hypothetical protein